MRAVQCPGVPECGMDTMCSAPESPECGMDMMCSAPERLNAGAPCPVAQPSGQSPVFWPGGQKKRPPPAFVILFLSFTGENMGLEDRDWYREEHKQKRRAEQGTSKPPPPPAPPKSRRPPPDLSAYGNVFQSPAPPRPASRLIPPSPARLPVRQYLKQFCLFLLLCFAVYGVFAMIHYIRNPIKKQPQQQLQQPDTKEKPKPAVRYL